MYLKWKFALKVAVCLTLPLAWAPSAGGQGSDLDAAVSGSRTTKRGTAQSLASHRVSVAGRRTATVGEIAARVFADHGSLSAGFKRARSGLRGDPVESTDVAETDDATVFSSSTSVSVSDPDAVRRGSPEFAQIKGAGEKFTVSALSAKAKSDLLAYKVVALKLPQGHPMRAAAQGGDQALLDAIAAGKGDYKVTTTVVIPKHPLARDSAGRVIPPKQRADGSFDPKSSRGSSSDESKRDGTRRKAKDRDANEPKVKEKGRAAHDADFLTGFTRGDRLLWSRRWDVPTGFFRIKAAAWYDYGLRVPVRVHSVTKPELIATTGAQDKDGNYEVTLSAKAFDADAAFYRELGLPASEVHDGKELVLRAGFSVTLTLKVMGIDINKTIPSGSAFDFGQNFRPPFGDCGKRCGFDVWVPASVTRTGISILGILKGSARFGVNVSGNGVVSVNYTALSGNDEIKSWFSGRSPGSAERRQQLDFKNGGRSFTLLQTAPAINQRQGGTRKYGFRVSQPKYSWDVSLTPGVRADISVNAKPVFKGKFTVGPMWLDDMAIRLGTIHLRGHDGTPDAHVVKLGEKRFAPK